MSCNDPLMTPHVKSGCVFNFAWPGHLKGQHAEVVIVTCICQKQTDLTFHELPGNLILALGLKQADKMLSMCVCVILATYTWYVLKDRA